MHEVRTLSNRKDRKDEMKYQSRADLLITAGESIKLQEEFDIKPMCKCNSSIPRPIADMFFTDPSDSYEFPLAVLEDMPIFIHDELFTKNGEKCSVYEKAAAWMVEIHVLFDEGIVRSVPIHTLSWRSPKSKTVMVELLREDAEWLAKYAYFPSDGPAVSAGKSCRAALEN